MVVIRFALLNLLGDKIGSFTVLGENHSKNFDEFIARGDYIGNDCTKRDWDYVREGSKCNFLLCLIPSSVLK